MTNKINRYCFADSKIEANKANALINCKKYNSLNPLDIDAHYELLKDILGSVGEEIYIEKRFNFDNGKNIHIGSHFLANYNLTILDIAEVTIGDYVLIGPNVLITTVNHPLSPKERRNKIGLTSPVTIGNDVWIGANVCILPGVTIGNNVVIGAGAVVNCDIPDNSLAVGIPAKVIKEIENDLNEI